MDFGHTCARPGSAITLTKCGWLSKHYFYFYCSWTSDTRARVPEAQSHRQNVDDLSNHYFYIYRPWTSDTRARVPEVQALWRSRGEWIIQTIFSLLFLCRPRMLSDCTPTTRRRDRYHDSSSARPRADDARRRTGSTLSRRRIDSTSLSFPNPFPFPSFLSSDLL